MWLRAAVVVLSGVLVYTNALSGQFLFDDENAIVTNSTIRQLQPLTVPLSPPRDTPVAGRPLVNLTFALNYASTGLDVRAYRLTNLAVHLLAGLVLFGIVRRSLLGPKLASHFGAQSLTLAWACALVWTLHPLNTEAVNYLAERTESLMGLCYLLTVYCAIRGVKGSGLKAQGSGLKAQGSGLKAQGSGLSAWDFAAVLACTAGMACKESMVTAPFIVALYDRVFLFDSVKDAVRRRWHVYAGLAASWLVLALLLSGQPRTSAGFGSGTDPWTYFLNQMDIIVRYLRLSVWPQGLVLDYGLPQSLTLADVVWPAGFLTALGLATLIAIRYRPFVGFLGAWFFITLSPTSSFVPIATEVGAERRMYLPLAGLVVLAVVGSYALIAARAGRPTVVAPALPRRTRGDTPLDDARESRRGESRSSRSSKSARVSTPPMAVATRLGIGVLVSVCALLASGTIARNREYRSRLSMAQTIVDRRPHGRAHFLLGSELVSAGEHDRAMAELRLSARDYPGAHYALATELLFAGQLDETITHAKEFIRQRPNDSAVVPARELLARALGSKGDLDGAAEQFALIVQRVPQHAVAQASLGDIRLRQRRLDEAISHFESALKVQPTDSILLGKLGLALAQAGRMSEATTVLERAVAGRPADVGLANMLGQALAAQGRYAEALTYLRRVVQLLPGDAQAARNLSAAERLATK